MRLDLAQAADAQRFAAGAGAMDAVTQRTLRRAALLEAALAQPLRSCCPMEDQVCCVPALFECRYWSI